MSGEFDLRKDSHTTKFEWRPWIFIKLSFRELCDSKLSGFMAIIHWVKNRLKTEKTVHGTPIPWSSFCDPHWELICLNKWHPGTSEIFTSLEIEVGTHFHVQHCTKTTTKTTPVFLPVDGEASWLLLPNSVSLLSGGTVQPENTYSFILRVTGQVWESQKRIHISTNHSYHQHSSP